MTNIFDRRKQFVEGSLRCNDCGYFTFNTPCDYCRSPSKPSEVCVKCFATHLFIAQIDVCYPCYSKTRDDADCKHGIHSWNPGQKYYECKVCGIIETAHVSKLYTLMELAPLHGDVVTAGANEGWVSKGSSYVIDKLSDSGMSYLVLNDDGLYLGALARMWTGISTRK